MKSVKEHVNYDPVLLSKDAAAYLGVHEETLKKWARERKIGCVREFGAAKGRPVKFRLSQLNSFAQRFEQKPVRAAAS